MTFEVAITDPIADGIQTGAFRITGKADLNRCGTLAEYREAIGEKVLGEVDKNVDLVFLDGSGDRFVGQVGNRPPTRGVPLKLRSEVIGSRHGRVAIDFEVLRVVMPEEGKEISANHVVAKIRRNVAHAQAMFLWAINRD